jgi:hypothetical protein
LADVVDRIEITPGKQGQRPFDIGRVRIRLTDEDQNQDPT